MRKRDSRLIFSPSDLNVFFESPFGSWKERQLLEQPGATVPDEPAAQQKLVANLGIAHEERYVETLRAEGRRVWEPAAPAWDFAARHAETLQAMAQSHEVLYQAALRHGAFEGHADFLFRVDGPSKLGTFRYEVADTKLARKPKPYFLLQLCAYAKMLEGLQGARPERVHVINGKGEQLTFRTDDYFFYFLSVEQRFLEHQRAFDPANEPLPEARDDHGRWQTAADGILESLDHLCRVAGATSLQVRRLEKAGVPTMTALAAAASTTRVPRMETAVFERLQTQARLQLASAGLPTPLYEHVKSAPGEARFGLHSLPPISPADVYFDMEGYPLTEGGLEYLFGATYLEDGKLAFKDFWAHDRAAEKRTFEAFVDWVYARFQADPAMHVFHYASYEVSALRRLMSAHATREDEVDAMLRANVVVDLYRVVRQSFHIGIPSYSLKKVEHLYRPARAGDVATAMESVVEYARWIEERDGEDWTTSAILSGIRGYNREDCDSTCELRMWLAARQAEAGIAHQPPAKDEPKERKVDDPRAACQALAQHLLAAIPEDPLVRAHDAETWRVQELLAHLLDFLQREAKPVWWAMYDRRDKTHAQLVDDPDCLGACTRKARPRTVEKRSFLYEYAFDPAQETKLRSGKGCMISDTLEKVDLHKLDREAGRLELKLGATRAAPPTLLSLIPDDYVALLAVRDAILRVVTEWETRRYLPPALAAFLFRTPPTIEGVAHGTDILAGLPATPESVTALLVAMKDTTVAIQGPPGAGKTRVASTAILELVRRGYRVGVMSNSHAAVGKLLEEVQKRAAAAGRHVRMTKINPKLADDPLIAKGCPGVTGMAEIDFATADAPQVVGGTASAFSHTRAIGQFDYLFVDEAGQVAIANLVAVSPSARNLVLLGDQMQLGQPIQGSHPGESGLSTLEYLLQGHRTVPGHLGVFLGTTWRLHPEVCRFISGAVYDDKLTSEPHTAGRLVRLPSGGGAWINAEAGIVFVAVDHEGNAQASEEEVEAIAKIVAELRGRELAGDSPDRPRKLTDEDILLVAPYNLQVRALTTRFPSVRAGSVDKFQGQEAPVVIVSMCASSGELSARGIEFLLDPNRLNVALSRAESLAIVVGSPDIARTRVRSIAQMKLVNLFCRIVGHG